MSCKFVVTHTARLDKIIVDALKNKSRSQVEKLIKAGLVMVNGEIVKKCGAIVNSGDELLILDFDIKSDETPECFYELSLPIIFENDWYLAIDKPTGIAVHPGAGKRSPTVIDFSRKHLKISTIPNPAGYSEFGIVHRLDKDTSGVLLIAKNVDAQKELSRLFKERKIRKKYLSINFLSKTGRLNLYDEGKIECWIMRDPSHRLRYVCSSEKKSKSRDCVTFFRKIIKYNNVGVIEFFPYTGRTHQLRAVSKFVNCPIVNDPLYSTNFDENCLEPALRALIRKIKRMLLHAVSLEFECPFTKNHIIIESNLPKEFLTIINFLKSHQKFE